MSAAGCVASPSPEQTRKLGEILGGLLAPDDVIGLSGPLGAGKTCFVQGLARGLGVDATVPVTSPTFVLVSEYPGPVPLAHADFYRVESYGRLDDAGFDDLPAPGGVLVVEWPERFPEALPAERLQVRVEIASEGERRLYVEGRGARAASLARSFVSACR